MKNLKLNYACFLIFIFTSSGVIAQDFYNFNNYYNYSVNTLNTRKSITYDYITSINTFKIVLNSDSATKSVLVSNLMDTTAGNMSPILGAATWKDNEKELYCRSLLEFNFDLLPIEVRENPSLISSAELVLFPLNVEFNTHDNEKPSFFYIRQVLQHWDESTTSWKDQPITDSFLQNSVLIDPDDKNSPANIDVTAFVKNMMKKGNNGFMLFHDNGQNESLSTGQLFASPKNVNPDLRPQLIIYFESINRSRKYISQFVPGYLNYEEYLLSQQRWRNSDYIRNNSLYEPPAKMIGTYPSGVTTYTPSSSGYGHGHTTSAPVNNNSGHSVGSAPAPVKPISPVKNF